MYPQFGRKDLLDVMLVTLDTTHWLMSALKLRQPLKAVVFGRRRKKVRSEMDQIKQQQWTTTIHSLEGKTYCIACWSHLTYPTC
tara:strand:+ start:70 stop:321 length:252 start_codon:yes stop_codon:yes gene_type:complete